MAKVTVKELLEAGVHFGHQTQRWNPKMKPYIFGDRNGIHIINLELTLKYLEKALGFINQLSAEGKKILFVGTKRQAQEPVQQAAEESGMPYVNQRWLGGMLTNFETIRKSIHKIENIEKMEEAGDFAYLTKKEALTLKKEREKLIRYLSGIRDLKSVPGALFIVDVENERIAIKEAKKLGIPVIAIVDTNTDPDLVDYVIPGNDDAIKAIKLFTSAAASVIKGNANAYEPVSEEETEDSAEEKKEEPKAEEPKVEAPAEEKAATTESEQPKEEVEAAAAQRSYNQRITDRRG